VINVLFAFVFSSSWREARQELTDSFEPESAASAEPGARMYRALLPVSVATAIYLVGQMVLITYLPLYLKDAMGFSAYWSSLALALTQGGAMIGRVGWGVVSDRLFGGRRKVVLLLIGSLSALLVTALSFLSRDSSYYLLLPILFLAGVCLVGYQGVSYALIGEIAGKARTGAGLGMMITINAACATLGTPLFGYIVDRTGSYPVGWRVLAATLAVGIFGLAALIRDPRRA
jgi:predicted MFS family arabinose efflux permease